MLITIQERKLSLRPTYDITGTETTLLAQKAIFSFLPKLELRVKESKALVAMIRGKFSPLHHKFEFTLADGSVYAFQTEKIIKGVYVCQGPGAELRLYRHRGVRWSLFEGERQVASMTKNRLVIGTGNKYELEIDSDANHVLAICMVLALNTEKEADKKEGLMSASIGSLGPQDNAPDDSWTAR